MKHGTESSFWAKVDRKGPDECWLWTASKYKSGYGQFYWRRAHRVSYEIAFGPIPPDRPMVLHKCDIPNCVNPAHLYAGTHADNMRDRRSRHRTARMIGEDNALSKLTDLKVLEIRRLIASGLTHTEIANSFGVCSSLISMVNTGKIWSHVHA